MKKLAMIALILSVLMLAVGCGNDQGTPAATTVAEQGLQTPSATSAEGAPTEEPPTAEVTEAPPTAELTEPPVSVGEDQPENWDNTHVIG
ncbi:MAG: hypothetical protein E7620_03560 [Ruminococcaceae bacterium]|nr:hypothetical protein [Oscillospiraceae bacterium]